MLVAAVVLVAAVGLGAWFLTDALRTPAVDSAPSSSPSASAPPVTPTPSETPAAEEPSPTTSAPPEAEPEPSQPPAQSPEQRVVDSITGYYALMPAQRDAAWPLMTADYQENHAGGRGGYEAFWSTVEEVAVSDVSASGPDQGQATLTYRFSDGRTVQEVTSYRFVEEDGVLKIAGSDVLSSTEL